MSDVILGLKLPTLDIINEMFVCERVLHHMYEKVVPLDMQIYF